MELPVGSSGRTEIGPHRRKPLDEQFVRRRTNIAGWRREDDWLMGYGGYQIGRVLSHDRTLPKEVENRWGWSLALWPMAHGRAVSLEASLQAVKAAVLQHLEENDGVLCFAASVTAWRGDT